MKLYVFKMLEIISREFPELKTKDIYSPEDDKYYIIVDDNKIYQSKKFLDLITSFKKVIFKDFYIENIYFLCKPSEFKGKDHFEVVCEMNWDWYDSEENDSILMIHKDPVIYSLGISKNIWEVEVTIDEIDPMEFEGPEYDFKRFFDYHNLPCFLIEEFNKKRIGVGE